MSTDKELYSNLFKFIDDHKASYINLLSEAVAIPSVSCFPNQRDDVLTMVKWMECELSKLGVSVEVCWLGDQELPDGRRIRLPPVLLGQLGSDPKKPTICIYGHLDVQPAAKEDGWNSEPFELTEVDNKLYGRGASDDKGPVLCWLNAIGAYQQLQMSLPVNLKFVFEAMEESGSDGLDDLLLERQGSFLANVDYVCISDNYWLGKERPCLSYGLRGICYFYVEVECASKDLHSGLYGGIMNEAMSDLIYVLNWLIDKHGKILIPKIQDDVRPVTEEEIKLYEAIDFNVLDYKAEIGTRGLLHNEDKVQILMNRWRYPSLSIHGIEGAFAEPGTKTVIPRKVIGKFSIRIVPDQSPEKVEEIVVRYITDIWRKRGSKNKFKVHMVSGGKSWVTDPHHKNFIAAARATKLVYGVEPDYTREGGSIPITLTLQETTGKNVILIPIGACDDGAHSQNEKIDVRNYIQGSKLLAAYLNEIGKIHDKEIEEYCPTPSFA